MTKNLPIGSLYFEMLLEISKKARKKPQEFIEGLIKQTYNSCN